MRISIASGKGGTGKTTLTTLMMQKAPTDSIVWVDCDVEAPDGDVFGEVEWRQEQVVTRQVPELFGQCSGCGTCADLCRFQALAMAGGKPMVFPELCHSCGVCIQHCPAQALRERPEEVGQVRCGVWRKDGQKHVYIQGLLKIGSVASTVVIDAAKKEAAAGKPDMTLVDCPPGTTCSMVAAVKGSDCCILVTEPSLFGIHDLRGALSVAARIGIPAGVVLNKSDGSHLEKEVEELCQRMNVPLLLRIPYSREFAQRYAAGNIDTQISVDWSKFWRQVSGLPKGDKA